MDNTAKIEKKINKLNNANAGVRKRAAEALSNFAQDTANHLAIRNARGVAPLVRVTEDRATKTGAVSLFFLGDIATELRQHATEALLSLAMHIDNHQAIREAGGVISIVHLLDDTTLAIDRKPMDALLFL